MSLNNQRENRCVSPNAHHKNKRRERSERRINVSNSDKRDTSPDMQVRGVEKNSPKRRSEKEVKLRRKPGELAIPENEINKIECIKQKGKLIESDEVTYVASIFEEK